MAEGSTAKVKGVKLNPLQTKVHKLGMGAPNRTLSQNELVAQGGFIVGPVLQDALNALLRLSLIVMLRDSRNEITFRFSSKDEAAEAGAMQSDDKLILDQIKESHNQGIWTRTLKDKTGLPQATITRILKALEGKKLVKVVKSVKYPTRKIFMMAGIAPSADMTGGPWFTDNELDIPFVEALTSVIETFLKTNSIPDRTFQTLFPTSTTPYLPTVQEVGRHLFNNEISAVELSDEHIEALLELMIADGRIEKILVNNTLGNHGLDALRRSKKRSNGEMSDSDVEPTPASEDDEEAEDPDDSNDEDTKPKKKKARTGKAPKSDTDSDDQIITNHFGSDSSDDETGKGRAKAKKVTRRLVNDAGSAFVYRLLRPVKVQLGWLDMPCGDCPSESFCTELARPSASTRPGLSGFTSKGSLKPKYSIAGPGMDGVGMLGGVGAAIGVASDVWGATKSIGGGVAPVNPKDCHYLMEWLHFDEEGDDEAINFEP